MAGSAVTSAQGDQIWGEGTTLCSSDIGGEEVRQVAAIHRLLPVGWKLCNPLAHLVCRWSGRTVLEVELSP